MPSENLRKIALVTSSRADYGHLYWVLKELDRQPGLSVRLMVTGAHLSPEFGETIQIIEADGFEVSDRIECLLSSDTDVAMAKSIGLGTISFAERFAADRPDLLLLIADRFEMMAPATAALALRIPMAHIEGGERSEGAIDHSIRNALTMMSHLHFTTTAKAARRVVEMGEEPWRVHQVGAPSLDYLRRTQLLSPAELKEQLGLEFDRPPLVIAFHPVTLDPDPAAETEALYAALEEVHEPIVVCFPNADAGGRAVRKAAARFCDSREHAQLFVNLEPKVYWSLLQQARAIIGNSSSGIMEAASVGLPAVDIGRRQQGRERGGNVLHTPAEPRAIVETIHHALEESFRKSIQGLANPYGDGHAAERIVKVLCETPLDDRLLHKTETKTVPSGTGVETVGGAFKFHDARGCKDGGAS